MNDNIKKRIEDIRAGKVPEGYKKTKVGIVPDEWEVCRLSNYLYVNKEKNTELKYDKEDVFSISGEYGIVNQIEFLGRSYAGVSVEPYRIVYPQNIVYTKSPLKINPYGIIKSNQTNKTGIVSTLYAVYYCKDNTLSKYVEYYFGIDTTLNNYLLPLVNIGSKHDMKISDENVLSGYVSFPPLPEQQKIAEILSTQDKLIELHEKKIEQLKELKKGYLQKMFPQKGSKYPELRFKGFTDAWEQRKLSDCAGFRRGSFPQPYGNKEWYDGDGAMPFVQVADVADDMKLVNDTKQKISKLAQPMSVFAEKGSVLVTLQGSIGRVAITQYGAFVDRTVLIFDKYSREICKTFWAYVIKEKFIEEAKKAPGGTIKTITKEVLSDFDLILPSFEEQERIGAFLSNLDTLITLHQRKLEQEKEKKKALMKLLLTGIVRTI